MHLVALKTNNIFAQIPRLKAAEVKSKVIALCVAANLLKNCSLPIISAVRQDIIGRKRRHILFPRCFDKCNNRFLFLLVSM